MPPQIRTGLVIQNPDVQWKPVKESRAILLLQDLIVQNGFKGTLEDNTYKEAPDIADGAEFMQAALELFNPGEGFEPLGVSFSTIQNAVTVNNFLNRTAGDLSQGSIYTQLNERFGKDNWRLIFVRITFTKLENEVCIGFLHHTVYAAPKEMSPAQQPTN